MTDKTEAITRPPEKQTAVAPAAPVVPQLPPVTPTPLSASWSGRLVIAVMLLAIFSPPLLLGEDLYWLPICSKCAALAIFALGVDLIWGYTGLLSLGQGLYFGLGAYAVGYSLKFAKAAQDADLPVGTIVMPDFMLWCRMETVPGWLTPLANIWVALTVALVLPTLVAFLFGLLTFRLRIKGVYFSLITQALVLAVFTLVVNQQPYTGGVVGMNYLAKLELLGHSFRNPVHLYYLIASLLTVSFVACAWLMGSKFGRVLTGIRDSETRVLALGYNTAMYKAFAFAVAGLLSGLGGAFYVTTIGTAGPEILNIAFSIEAVILVAVGGRGTLIGALLGAFLVPLGSTVINNEFKQSWPLMLGFLFIGVVVFLPEGIVGLVRSLPTRVKKLLGNGHSKE